MGSRRPDRKSLFLNMTWRCEAPGGYHIGQWKAVGEEVAGGHARPRPTRVWRSRVLRRPAAAWLAELKK